MLLREHLEEYTKEQLLDQTRSFELRKCSGLRKAALIERILECFCTEEIPIDLDGNADTIATLLYPNGLSGKAVSVEKKIYPNDPCPCGSGKKYKKCCGRK